MSYILGWLGIALALGALVPAFMAKKMPLVWAMLVASNVLLAVSSALDGTWGRMAYSSVVGAWCVFAFFGRLRFERDGAS